MFETLFEKKTIKEEVNYNFLGNCYDFCNYALEVFFNIRSGINTKFSSKRMRQIIINLENEKKILPNNKLESGQIVVYCKKKDYEDFIIHIGISFEYNNKKYILAKNGTRGVFVSDEKNFLTVEDNEVEYMKYFDIQSLTKKEMNQIILEFLLKTKFDFKKIE